MTTTPQITALHAIWPTLTGVITTLAKLNALNTLMVHGPTQDVPASTIAPIFIQNPKYSELQGFVLNPPPEPVGSSLQAANYLWAILQSPNNAIFPALSVSELLTLMPNMTLDARTGVTAAEITALNGAVTPLELWYVLNGWTAPGVGVGDLIAAGGLY